MMKCLMKLAQGIVSAWPRVPQEVWTSRVREPIVGYGGWRGITRKDGKLWMNRHVNDPYVKASKQLDYRSRAAFKLLELDARYSLLKPPMKVLEVGSAPGSWTQVLTQKLNSTAANPAVISVDIASMQPVPGATFIQGDIEDTKVQDEIYKVLNFAKVDLVLSFVHCKGLF